MIHIPIFDNPEILQIRELPAKINHKCIYYSLALLIIDCMFDKFTSLDKFTSVNMITIEEKIEKEIDINETLKSIHFTKLYFFLERCFK